MNHKRSFTQYFGTSFHDIANLKETEKRNAQVLLKAFDEWRATQLNYSKRIGEVANLISSLNKSKTQISTQQSGLYIIYQQLHGILSVLGVQSNNLARKIQDDIIIEFKELVRKLNSQLGISVHMEKNSRRALMSKKTFTQKVYGEYLTSKKSMQENQVLNVLVTNSCQSNLQKRLKQIQKTAECQKQFKLMDFKYRQAVSEYNQQVAMHSTTVANILYKFQHQETELIKASHQSILKAILHLSTKHKTLSHEIDRISEEATQFSYSDCLESTAEKFANSPPSQFANVVFEPNLSFIGETIRMICDKTIDTLIEKCKNKILKQTIQKAIKSKQIQGLQDNSLKQFLGQFLAIIEGSELQRLQKIKDMLRKIENRAFFVGCLQQYRLIGKFVMSQKSINNLQKMTMVFLDQCFEYKDAYFAKQVMALLFTYFYVNEQDPQKSKIYLQQLVRDHPLWESKQFWQSALLMCIYEERKNILNMNIDQKEMQVEAERNAVFNQLTCIPHNMVLFGFQEKDAKAFATKYAKLLHLGSRLKDIEKNIESADKIEKKSSSSSTKSPQMINKDSIRSENLPLKESTSTKSLRQF